MGKSRTIIVIVLVLLVAVAVAMGVFFNLSNENGNDINISIINTDNDNGNDYGNDNDSDNDNGNENDNESDSQDIITAIDGVLRVHQTTEEHIVTDDETGIMFVNNELLLTVHEGVTTTDVESFVRIFGAEIVGYDTYLRKYQILLPLEYSLTELESVQEEFWQSGLFLNVRVNLAFEIEPSGFTPNDSEWRNEWNNPNGRAWGALAIRAPEMWAFYREEQRLGVNVGVLDTQFYEGHEDLEFVRQPFFNAFNGCNHGTHVAGTIAATFNDNKGIAGIAPNVNLFGASFDGMRVDGRITVSTWESGLTYLIAVRGCRVINLSMGASNNIRIGASHGDPNHINILQQISSELEEALLFYLENGDHDFVVIKTAGNNGDRGGLAQFDILSNITNDTLKSRIIVVGNAELNENQLQVQHQSSFGPRVDVIAPGTRIESTVHRNASFFGNSSGYEYVQVINNQRYYWTGTSMAAPHVAGVAAAMWSVNPNLTGAEVKRIIVETATGLFGYADSSITYRYPMLDAYAAVRAAAEWGATPAPPSAEFTGTIANGTYHSQVGEQLVSLLPQIWTFFGENEIRLSAVCELIVSYGTYVIRDNTLYITSVLFGVETTSVYTITNITPDSFVLDGILFIRE